jgi:hypothetical protein
MDVAHAEIETAIDEVTKTRQSVMRRRSKQVTSADEIDRLKSVAFAWFQTHRQLLAEHSSCPDLSAVDSAYQEVMEATGRHAARTTYIKALARAKQALLPVRSFVAGAPASGIGLPTVDQTTDEAPSFAVLVADTQMQAILARRWTEVQQCTNATAYLAATVMMGGLLESLLLARINTSPNKAEVFKAQHAPRDKSGTVLTLGDWKLVHMVEVAYELGWITKCAKDIGHVLREFRNYIHPHKEHTDGIQISADDAGMFWEVTKSISRQVLGSVRKSP